MTIYDDALSSISRSASTLVVVALDRCEQVHGVSPCLASGVPCYNTFRTCGYKAAYTAGAEEVKFCLNESPQPLPGQIIRPYVKSVTELSQEVRLDESLLVNQRVTIDMLDEADADIGVDPYRVSPTLRESPGGSESVATAGTFWRKLRSRSPNYKNRRVRVLDGFVADGFQEADYVTRFEGVLDNIQVASDGGVTLTVKGLLQLADVEYPVKTDGTLAPGGLSSGATTLQLTAWTGVDRYALMPDSLYSESGLVVIGNEIIGYTSRSLDTNTGVTTFSGLSRGLHSVYGYGVASAHNAAAQVQQAVYLSGNPIDIMHALLNQAGLADTEIDVDMFEAERDTWFQGVVFTTVLFKPVKIKALLKELRDQTLTFVWQGEDQLIKVRSVTPKGVGQTYVQITDAANIVHDSRAIDDNEAGRITRAVVWYDILAKQDGSSDESFRRAAAVIDADAESADEYAEQKDKEPIYSRWIKILDGGDDYARTLASRIVRRFRDGAKTITFSLDRKDEALALGELFELSTAAITDFNGSAKKSKYIVTKKQRRGAVIEVTAYDSQLTGRPAFIAANTVATTYAAATDADKEYCYISSGTPLSPGGGDDVYLII